MVDAEKERPEVFIALIAPIGVDLNLVQNELCGSLQQVSYQPHVIKFTKFLEEHPDWFDLKHSTEFERYERYIEAGNSFCDGAERRDALALAGIAQLYADQVDRPEIIPSATAHVFRQVKRVEEIKTLRQVYGTNVIFVGCYAPRRVRVKNLVSILLKGSRGTDQNQLEAEALRIIGIDENQKDVPHGQRFLDAYPYSDFIVDCTNPNTVRESMDRLVKCFFGHPFVSPNRDEHGMYLAHSASMRSTDLSRQVGASIFGANREIVSLGCNEVPASGGGTYWLDSPSDARDFQLGYDSNARLRADMIRDMFARLKDANWLGGAYGQLQPENLAKAALEDSPDKQGPLAKAMVADIIEYGRIVHAEMNAISDAARFGRETRGGTLYCTTMPCHLCTKLIIASGITQVQYLQPYYKSLVKELYEDSVAVDEKCTEKVSFQPFRGVTPNGFSTVFSKGKRKREDDTAVQWTPANSEPISISDLPYYLINEANIISRDFQDVIRKMSLLRNPLKI